MKKITEEEVYETLVDYPSLEIEGLDEDDLKVVYYLHMKEDGTIVDCTQKSDVDFTDWIPYWDYVDTVDEFRKTDIYDYERMDFKPFAQVVKNITQDANDWLEYHEKEEED